MNLAKGLSLTLINLLGRMQKSKPFVHFLLPRPDKTSTLFFSLWLVTFIVFVRTFLMLFYPSLLRQSVLFKWSPECQSAFDSIKLLLTCCPDLSAPDPNKPFKLQVDASGTGAVLIQEDDHGVDQPVCFFSKKFLKHQLNYSISEKETLAL